MKRLFPTLIAIFFVTFWAQGARAVPTDFFWTGTCLDCSFEGESAVPSPASARFTVDNGLVTAFSYNSALYAFSAGAESLFAFGFTPAGPLPAGGNLFLFGDADFTLFDGAAVSEVEPSVHAFLFGTIPTAVPIIIDEVVIAESADWALCVDFGSSQEAECVLLGGATSSDFGTDSTFATAGVPEPSGLAILGLGLLGLGAARRIRKAT